MRFSAYFASLFLSLVLAVLGAYWPAFLWGLAASLPLALVGTWDFLQRDHTLRRNYPLLAHFRWFFEAIRPEIRQYLFEGPTDGRPFSRDQRSLVYQRAKNVEDRMPFGTEQDVYADGYEWITHSMTPATHAETPFRVTVGGPQCAHPYSTSILNISAMSFGSLSANAVLALNKGAAKGGFAHDTGEGGISRYHREHKADLIWEIGSGYFGCRDDQGRFNAERFRDQAAIPEVRMIEVKLSQGAKPGHGGVLPAAKVTPEIAEARHVPVGRDVISPALHSAFSTPIEFMEFLGTLRELSGGKPVGFKLCLGHPWEFLAILKAILDTGILPDFVVVDGAEGGTGAAPLELTNHVGTPLRDALTFVDGALTGIGKRGEIRVAAAGKISSGFRMAAVSALGADWCNAARAFMFTLGCVQSQHCHTGKCPTGITTQDPLRQRALVVADKSERVYQFHKQTVAAFAGVLASAGLKHPSELRPRHLCRRVSPYEVRTAAEIYPGLAPGELLAGTENQRFRTAWRMAQATSFTPAA